MAKGFTLSGVIFIDDIPLIARSEEEALKHTAMTLNLLELLGFLVSYPKVTASANPEHKLLGLQGGLQHSFTQPAGAESCSDTSSSESSESGMKRS